MLSRDDLKRRYTNKQTIISSIVFAVPILFIFWLAWQGYSITTLPRNWALLTWTGLALYVIFMYWVYDKLQITSSRKQEPLTAKNKILVAIMFIPVFIYAILLKKGLLTNNQNNIAIVILLIYVAISSFFLRKKSRANKSGAIKSGARH